MKQMYEKGRRERALPWDRSSEEKKCYLRPWTYPIIKLFHLLVLQRHWIGYHEEGWTEAK